MDMDRLILQRDFLGFIELCELCELLGASRLKLLPKGRSFPVWCFFYIVPLDPGLQGGDCGVLSVQGQKYSGLFVMPIWVYILQSEIQVVITADIRAIQNAACDNTTIFLISFERPWRDSKAPASPY